MYTDEEKVWVEKNTKNTDDLPVPDGDVSVPEDENDAENVGTDTSQGVWTEVTNSNLLDVTNDVRMDVSSIKYDMEQLARSVDKLTLKISALEFTVTEALRMCQVSFVKIEQAVVACSIGYEKCQKGYAACKEGFEAVEELVEDFPNRIDCGVATGYL